MGNKGVEDNNIYFLPGLQDESERNKDKGLTPSTSGSKRGRQTRIGMRKSISR